MGFWWHLQAYHQSDDRLSTATDVQRNSSPWPSGGAKHSKLHSTAMQSIWIALKLCTRRKTKHGSGCMTRLRSARRNDPRKGQHHHLLLCPTSRWRPETACTIHGVRAGSDESPEKLFTMVFGNVSPPLCNSRDLAPRGICRSVDAPGEILSRESLHHGCR